ncbi:MAG: hypothetical protein U9R29_09790 [Thermodesulfobacteriota bacterium]|nr:hypothetical protein [Thermodesulfobacteriota bacterium]
MTYKNILHTLLLTLAFLTIYAPIGQAIEVAPRISDRDIIEKLAGLEAGQKALDVRISDLRSEMKAGQKALNTRMGSLENTMLALFGALIALIVALIGYLAWDRRTMIRPVVERLDNLEREVVRDLDLRHVDGSLLVRQLKALKEYAQNDAKLAEILRSLSLL